MIDDPLFREDWDILVKTRDGVVSLIRNLSLADANRVANALQYQRGIAVDETKIIGPDDWDGCRKAMRHTWVENVRSERMVERECAICGARQLENL
jgi:hypothetical protein